MARDRRKPPCVCGAIDVLCGVTSGRLCARKCSQYVKLNYCYSTATYKVRLNWLFNPIRCYGVTYTITYCYCLLSCGWFLSLSFYRRFIRSVALLVGQLLELCFLRHIKRLKFIFTVNLIETMQYCLKASEPGPKYSKSTFLKTNRYHAGSVSYIFFNRNSLVKIHILLTFYKNRTLYSVLIKSWTLVLFVYVFPNWRKWDLERRSTKRLIKL